SLSIERTPSWPRSAAMCVFDDLSLLQRDQAAAARVFHQRVELRQGGANLFFGVDDFDQDREILGEAQNLCGMNAARRAVAFDPSPHCRPRQPELARFEND